MKKCNGEVAVEQGWRRFGNSAVAAAAVMMASLIAATPAAQAQPAACTPPNCASLSVGSTEIASGGMGSVAITFNQAPGNGASGGPDEIAAIALTLQISPQLELADCALDASGLPAAVTKGAGLSNFRVVVENASCTAGRTHCLCDPPGEPDDFINIVVYGPDPLPAPGSGPVDIPTIPSGELMTIALRASGSPGTVPLDVVQETDGAKPQFQAFLSIGDKNAVDQTCVPQAGTPPCTGGGAVYQITVGDGQVEIIGGCVGDCNGDGSVTVDEIVRMVNIALGSQDVSTCPAADRDGSGTVTVDEIVQAVNNALNGCPA
jgi:hypothetical protein